MILQHWLLLFVLFVGVVLSISTGKLTITGALTGGLAGLLVFMGAGFTGIAMLGLFFIMGVLATGWQVQRKEALGAAEKDKGRRTAGQVLANGGVAALTGGLAWLFPGTKDIFPLMMAASLASAAADTLSSELGMICGRRFYNIVSFRKDRCGENGVISLEGTLLGVAGSILIASIYALGYGWGVHFLWIVLAGTLGNLADSLLGATLERKRILGNNAVNLLSTLSAAFVAGMLAWMC